MVRTLLKITRLVQWKSYLAIIGPNSHAEFNKYEIRSSYYLLILFYLPLFGPNIQYLSIFSLTYLHVSLFTSILPYLALITLILSYLPVISLM